MIQFIEEKNIFLIETKNTSYIMNVLESKHVGHLYYGKKVSNMEVNHFYHPYQFEKGTTISYSESIKGFSLNDVLLELATFGKGDFRSPSFHFRLQDGSRITDFLFKKYEIVTTKPELVGLPQANGANQSLIITVYDEISALEIELYYSCFYDMDVITRSAKIKNLGSNNVVIEKAMSCNVDFHHANFELLTLDGSWIRERHVTTRPLYGITKIDSKKGVSSNDHNPFIALKAEDTTEFHGDAYGFSLIYSGNFEATVEVSPQNLTRVLMGINSFDFSWLLKKDEEFFTPEVVLTYSNKGLNQMSQNIHEFVKKKLIPKNWQHKERPILINNWEATYFDFNEGKLLQLAKEAKKMGIELFVLDDGWFGKRNDDKSGLGDWFVNYKKLKHGIEGFSKKINKLGMMFGIWVEPEMVSVDSELYRTHPEWAVKHPKREASYGRNQLLLDFTNPDVRNYIVSVLSEVFESGNVAYCKWDMNRTFSDVYSNFLTDQNQSEFHHRFVLGLYEVLDILVHKFPDMLFESCASGGNRFDLGMLYYTPQIWTSDNTDAYERQKIQWGTSYPYPISTMGAHVSQSPNHQIFRATPLESRFNVAAFGLLGYELNLSKLTRFDKLVIKNQIEFYKKHRKLLQFGTFYRLKNPFITNNCIWMVMNEKQDEAIVGYYQTLAKPNPNIDVLSLFGFDDNSKYKVETRKQFFNVRTFGDHLNQALPIDLKLNGTLHNIIANNYLFEAEKEEVIISGNVLNNFGFLPKHQFTATGFNESVRVMEDFGSRLYYFKKETSK